MTETSWERKREREWELGCGLLTWATYCQSRGQPVMVDHILTAKTLVGSPD